MDIGATDFVLIYNVYEEEYVHSILVYCVVWVQPVVA